jgi:hypothetical protein
MPTRRLRPVQPGARRPKEITSPAARRRCRRRRRRPCHRGCPSRPFPSKRSSIRTRRPGRACVASAAARSSKRREPPTPGVCRAEPRIRSSLALTPRSRNTASRSGSLQRRRESGLPRWAGLDVQGMRRGARGERPRESMEFCGGHLAVFDHPDGVIALKLSSRSASTEPVHAPRSRLAVVSLVRAQRTEEGRVYPVIGRHVRAAPDVQCGDRNELLRAAQ